MIDIEELKRKALAAQQSADSSGERWPTDEDWVEFELMSAESDYIKAINPAAVLGLIERLEAAEREAADQRALAEGLQAGADSLRKDAARYRIMEAGADQRAKCLLHLLGPDCRKGYIHDLDVSEHEASPEVQMLAHVLVSERPGKFALIHLVAYLLDAAIAKGKT